MARDDHLVPLAGSSALGVRVSVTSLPVMNEERRGIHLPCFYLFDSESLGTYGTYGTCGAYGT